MSIASTLQSIWWKSKSISTASDRILLASDENKNHHDDIYALFQPQILSAIPALRLKHKRPDINSFYEHFTMIEASTAKEFIEGVILQMIKDGTIINKKSLNGYDLFHRKLSTGNDNINLGKQPKTNTASHFLSDNFTPPQYNNIIIYNKVKMQNWKHNFLCLRVM